MKTTKPNWQVKKFVRLSDNGELRFDYPIQRKSGQWDELQKSLLIHSIVGEYPIPPVAIVETTLDDEEEDREFVIDGRQRITNVLDFISGVKDENGKYPKNAYKLHKFTPSIEIEEVGKPVELADKYFDELPEDMQTKIMSSTFQIQHIQDATDEEIEELFARWNNGTPLTKQQKARAKMGTKNARIIDTLQNHNFFTEKAKFTALQRKRSDDEAVVLQSMILLSGEDFESFVADKLLKYASDMRNKDITQLTNDLKIALDYADESLTESLPILKKLHLPTILLMAKKAHDENIDKRIFKAWVEDFNNAYNGRTQDKALVKTRYKAFTGEGSVKKNKVLGRKEEMLKHFNEFLTKYVLEEEATKNENNIVNENKEETNDLSDKVEIIVVTEKKDEEKENLEIDVEGILGLDKMIVDK